MKKKIVTNNREIYEKFSLLNFSPEIVLKDVKLFQVDRILRNINRGGNVLVAESAGNYVVVKKLRPINFDLYFK